MKYRNEALAFAIVILCGAGVLFLRANSIATVTGMAIAAGNSKLTVYVDVDYGAGQKFSNTLSVDYGTKAIDALKAAGPIVKMDQSKIACIDNICNSAAEYWSYTVNGVSVTEDMFLAHSITENERLGFSFSS